MLEALKTAAADLWNHEVAETSQSENSASENLATVTVVARPCSTLLCARAGRQR